MLLGDDMLMGDDSGGFLWLGGSNDTVPYSWEMIVVAFYGWVVVMIWSHIHGR